MVAAFVALSPGTSFDCNIAGRPATFMVKTVKSPDVAANAALTNSGAEARELKPFNLIFTLLHD